MSDSIDKTPQQKRQSRPMLLDQLDRFTLIVAGLAVTMAGFFIWAAFDNDLKSQKATVRFGASDELQQVEKRMTALEGQIAILTGSGVSVEPTPEVAELAGEVALLGERLELLENGLLDSPERALAVPLMRKDLESLNERFVADSLETARSVDRMYDQNKWFIGLMLTMAVGLMGLAISNLIQARSGS